jgi:hypothetical protein
MSIGIINSQLSFEKTATKRDVSIFETSLLVAVNT